MAENATRSANHDGNPIDAMRSELTRLSKLVDDLMSGDRAGGERVQGLARKGKKVVAKAVDKGKAAVSGIESTVSHHPLASMAVAFGLGMVLGRLIRR